MDIKLIDLKISTGTNITVNNNDVFVDYDINEENQTISFNALVGENPHNNRWKIVMTYQLMTRIKVDYENQTFLEEIRATVSDVAEELFEIVTTLDSLIRNNVN